MATNPSTGPLVPVALQMECHPIIDMRDEAQDRPSRSKVERRRNAGINRPGVLNNDNAVNAKRITGRDTTVGAAAGTNTAIKSNKVSIVVKGINI